MSDLEMRVDAIARCLLADEPEAREKACANLRKLMNGTPEPARTADAESIVRDILLELGAQDHLAGHSHLVRGILLVLEDQKYISNVMYGLYPRLAEIFASTPLRIERSIRHVIETTWMRGDPDVLFKYFGNTVSAEKGKPTNSEFIARIANVVKMRMRGVA